MKKNRILVVEDEPAILMGLEENLGFAGYEVVSATTGLDALDQVSRRRPDLVLLDVMLPGMSGFELCRKLRAAGNPVPVIMLTARAEEFDKLHGFESGADDYVTKPFSMKELLARMQAVLVRTGGRATAHKIHEFGDCTLDCASRQLFKKGRLVTLTRTEFELLVYLCDHETEALSRDKVMNDVWGMEYYGTQRSLDSFVASLRGKIERDKHQPRHILTVHGVGYKFQK